MKKLLLIRHGEAAGYAAYHNDFDRPLTEKGKADVKKAAGILKQRHRLPQLFYCSSARRTVETAAIIATVLKTPAATLKPEIYEASAAALLRLITQFDDRLDFTGITGHNPGVSNLIYNLCNELFTMETSAVVEIELQAGSWKEVSVNSGKVVYRQLTSS